jgi:crotonobetainyl-CoA:carnitine CoA-transferase CaiB-like acyl-CoA transferase
LDAQLIAQPYMGTKLAEFEAEVIHVERPGGDVFRFTAPQLTRGPRPHGFDEAEVTKNKLSMGPGGSGAARAVIGDDTTDILARMLGLSEGAIDKLYVDGVVHRTEPFTEPQVAAVDP